MPAAAGIRVPAGPGGAEHPDPAVYEPGPVRRRPRPDTRPVQVPWPAAGPGDDCDASIVPVLSGHVDPVVLDRLAALVLRPGLWAGQNYDPGPTGGPDAGDR